MLTSRYSLRPTNTRTNKVIASHLLGSMAPLLAIVLAWIRPSLGALIVLWTTLYAAYLVCALTLASSQLIHISTQPFQRIRLGTTIDKHSEFLLYDIFLGSFAVLALAYLVCLHAPLAWNLPQFPVNVAALAELMMFFNVFLLLLILAVDVPMYSIPAEATESELSPSNEAELKPLM